MSTEQLKIKLGDSLLENEPLANHTNFKIGGPAKYFFVAENEEDLVKAVKAARSLNLPYFILGGGSNILVSDEGFDGMVIQIKDLKLKIEDDLVTVGVGVKLSNLIDEALKNGLVGLEFLAGIPGNVGGAVYGNAGAWGQSIGDFIKEIKVFDGETVKVIKKAEADFSYRHSRFKNPPASGLKEIILEVTLELTEGDVEVSKQKIKEILDKRHTNQPYQSPCAGCTFKNVPVAKINLVKNNLLQFVSFKEIPTAYLIEQCGLKGKTIGGAQVSEKHGNFIINTGNAKASEILELVKFVKEKIKEKFGVDLEEEIILVGF